MAGVGFIARNNTEMHLRPSFGAANSVGID
jgi:hypothetical protein